MAARKPTKTTKKAAPKKAAARKPAKAAAAPEPEPVELEEVPMPAAPAAPKASGTVPPYPQTPVLPMGKAVVVMVCNAIPGLAGLGTLLAGIFGSQRLIGRAAAQFVLQIAAGAGYVWSVITGIQGLINASWGNKNPGGRSA
jgi:hypothetical protein